MKIEDITVPTPDPSPSGAGKQRSRAEGERNFQQDFNNVLSLLVGIIAFLTIQAPRLQHFLYLLVGLCETVAT